MLIINHWDIKEKERNLAREDYKYRSLLEEASWRQKFRELWLKEGERNTGFFFQKMANSHRRRNFVKKIKINEIWFEEEASIRWEVACAYQDFLSDPVAGGQVYRA